MGMPLSQLTNIFQRGRSTTNQNPVLHFIGLYPRDCCLHVVTLFSLFRSDVGCLNFPFSLRNLPISSLMGGNSYIFGWWLCHFCWSKILFVENCVNCVRPIGETSPSQLNDGAVSANFELQAPAVAGSFVVCWTRGGDHPLGLWHPLLDSLRTLRDHLMGPISGWTIIIYHDHIFQS